MPDKSDGEEWLGATTPPGQPPSKRDRSRRWLEHRRRDRAHKSVRRKLKKALLLLWDVESRLVAQDLAFSPVHRALAKAIEDLNRFQDDYDRSVTATFDPVPASSPGGTPTASLPDA
jgi:hypothetical protein